mmetsp:Transcript_32793/g.64992  ORF Transcript_32793/g.64992 Transcript_32793/m.64992 type:complete len:104 (-) Transcript_32793:631-942(-)
MIELSILSKHCISLLWSQDHLVAPLVAQKKGLICYGLFLEKKVYISNIYLIYFSDLLTNFEMLLSINTKCIIDKAIIKLTIIKSALIPHTHDTVAIISNSIIY